MWCVLVGPSEDVTGGTLQAPSVQQELVTLLSFLYLSANVSISSLSTETSFHLSSHYRAAIAIASPASCPRADSSRTLSGSRSALHGTHLQGRPQAACTCVRSTLCPRSGTADHASTWIIRVLARYPTIARPAVGFHARSEAHPMLMLSHENVRAFIPISNRQSSLIKTW